MKNIDQWRPTKYVQTKTGLRASHNTRYVAAGSRFFADLVAHEYEKAIRKHAKGRLLDLGCGSVPLYGVYSDLVSENVCVDWDKTLHTSPHLDCATDLGAALPFDTASFDTVLLTDVLEHLKDPVRVLGEIGRILRPGGKLIVGVPFLYWIHEEPHDYYRYTEYALRHLCSSAGLRVIECYAYGGLAAVLVDLTAKGLGLHWAGRLLRPFHAAAAFMVMKSPRVLGMGSDGFPLGYILIAGK